MTGVQTCALPISQAPLCWLVDANLVDIELIQIAIESIYPHLEIQTFNDGQEVLDALKEGEIRLPDLMLLEPKMQIGRASCRERV